MHHSTTRLCSSWLSVGLSPVVPTGTRPWVPSEICQFTSERNAASSSEPFLNGVTRAVKDPRNFVLAAMELLPTLSWRGWPFERRFISGLRVPRKARNASLPRSRLHCPPAQGCPFPLRAALPHRVATVRARFSRDFAVVAAQKPAPRRTAFSILSAVSVKLAH